MQLVCHSASLGCFLRVLRRAPARTDEQILRIFSGFFIVLIPEARVDAALTDHGLIALALLVATSLVAGFFAYIHSVKRQTYLLLWMAGWCFLALHYLSSAFTNKPLESSIQNSVDQWLFGLAGVLFFLGAQLYAQRKPWLTAAAISTGVLAAWAIANAFLRFPISVLFAGGIIYLAVGSIFWVESRRQETLADRLLAIVFYGWGILGMSFVVFHQRFADWRIALHPASSFPAAFAAILMVMALYEEEKQRVERNMLALSNLNLATSSFVGGEIHRMLSQALDRVLGVVRLPAGALFFASR